MSTLNPHLSRNEEKISASTMRSNQNLIKSQRRTRIFFWVSTTIIFLFEGVMPALTSQTALAKQGISHLGYPEYFSAALVTFKILGVIALVIPNISARIKEWAYAGFTFNFIFAFISNVAVDGLQGQSLFPLVILMILVISYISYHQLRNNKQH